jgi:uncharacterized membrane protein YdfJ with MMPL/SSD domain
LATIALVFPLWLSDHGAGRWGTFVMRAGWILVLAMSLVLAACAGQAIKDKMPA